MCRRDRRKNGEVWFATYDGGILIYEKGEKVKVLTESDTPYLYSDCVSALCEDCLLYTSMSLLMASDSGDDTGISLND